MLSEKDHAALHKARELCAEGGHTLLYLTRHGSHLYGTNTPNSDADYKGVFLPNLLEIVMGRKFHTLDFQSKDDATVKNTNQDVDLQLFSIQFWLNKLVKKGETEGIELLYSYTNRDAVVYCHPNMMDIFIGRSNLFDPRNTKGFLGFAISQARTYFTKAERFNVIKNVFEFLNDRGAAFPDPDRIEHLSDVIDEILMKYMHPTYCFETQSNDLRSIQVCGKVHQETIELAEFFDRIQREYKKYGHRTKTAADLNNKDWKSLSHALKAIIEVKTLLTTGTIEFPLPERDLLRSIKTGDVPFDDVEKLIFDGIDDVDKLTAAFDNPYWNHKSEYVKITLLKMYGEQMSGLVAVLD